MIRNKEYLEAFEDRLIAEEEIDFARNMEIYEAMYREAVESGIFPLKDPLDGIEVAVRISKILNRLPITEDDIHEIREMAVALPV
jgi:hypothetical protein